MAKQVKVYSTPTCPWCIRVKQYLDDNSITYENVDVSTDEAAAQAMMNKTGQMGVPVIDIDGEIVVGFDKDKIGKSLGLT